MTVAFKTRTYKGAARFWIPKSVSKELGLRKAGGDSIRLTVDGPTGHYEGAQITRPGPEVYGKDIREGGIKKNQPIIIEISN